MDDQQHEIRYYDLMNNMVVVRGYDAMVPEKVKFLEFPGILSRLYTISEHGKVYSLMNDSYIAWNYMQNIPYVNLIKSSRQGIVLEPFCIKDLMAYSFIANAKNYLERGWKVVNIDGNPSNCFYSNIMFIDPNMVKK